MNSLLAMLCAFSEVFLLWFLVALVREYRKAAARKRSARTRTGKSQSMWVESMDVETNVSPRKPPQTAALVLMCALLILSGATLVKL